ncbi:MAG: hypothetical protein U5N26_08700 [Candidatus Marinimicrobia bacterium]|nr:hypothetical protein [Candidatus Neomarinimicrobiota bacterium]
MSWTWKKRSDGAILRRHEHFHYGLVCIVPGEPVSFLMEQIAAHHNGILIIKPVYDEIDPLPSADRDLPSGGKAGNIRCAPG